MYRHRPVVDNYYKTEIDKVQYIGQDKNNYIL